MMPIEWIQRAVEPATRTLARLRSGLAVTTGRAAAGAKRHISPLASGIREAAGRVAPRGALIAAGAARPIRRAAGTMAVRLKPYTAGPAARIGRATRTTTGKSAILTVGAILLFGAAARLPAGGAPAASGPTASAHATEVTAGGSATSSSAAASPGARATPSARIAEVPRFGHVYWIILEEHSLLDVANGGKAPFLASLVKQGAVAADYDALAEGSLPNYIGLFSGSTQDIADDGVHYLDSPSLFDQLDSHGKTWAVHSQNVPGSCFLGLSAEGGPDGPGTYVRRHEPAVSFTNIVADPVRCARIGDLSSFAPGRTDFTLIIPNMCADMHDCPVSVGDALLKKLVTKIRSSKSWSTDDLIVITFDEAGEGPQPPSRRPGLLALSGLARPAFVSHEDRNHYSLLRTIEDSWRLGCLANSCAAPALGELFGGP